MAGSGIVGGRRGGVLIGVCRATGDQPFDSRNVVGAGGAAIAIASRAAVVWPTGEETSEGSPASAS